MSRPAMKILPALAPLALLLSSCSLVPHYERPALPVAGQYPQPDQASGAAAADIGWNQFLRDDLLRDLVAASIANNRDLRVAALNVAAAQATYDQQHASLFPAIDGTAKDTASRSPHDLYPTASGAYYSRAYSLGVGTSAWEVDLFGRLRSLNQADAETVLSKQETLRATQLSLVSSVANQYLTILADRQLLELTGQTLSSDRDSLKLTQLTQTQGTGTGLDTAQAESLVRAAEANQAAYTRQLQQDIDELVLLVGAPLTPDQDARLRNHHGLDDMPALADVPAGLPSDLLTRRPDVMAAEHDLRSANANIGAARAAFFPNITITASGGTASSNITRLFAGGQADWSFMPQITLPIFDEGRNQAALDLAKVQKRIEIATYEKTIQTAFREVSDALAGRATYDQQLAAQQALVKAEQRDYDLSQMRFKAGVDNYLSTLVSQRSLYSAQTELVSVHLAQLQSRITLYKVLGGGWKE